VPVSRALRRLLRLRELEEEQNKAALESALGESRALESALRAAHARERAGRVLIGSGAHRADPIERVGGLVEAEAGRHAVGVLAPRVATAARRAAALREEYLAVRVERRQVDTVIHEAEEREAVQQSRKEQQNLDELFGVRRHARYADHRTPE
jgi:hypothetical protein